MFVETVWINHIKLYVHISIRSFMNLLFFVLLNPGKYTGKNTDK